MIDLTNFPGMIPEKVSLELLNSASLPLHSVPSILRNAYFTMHHSPAAYKAEAKYVQEYLSPGYLLTHAFDRPKI